MAQNTEPDGIFSDNGSTAGEASELHTLRQKKENATQKREILAAPERIGARVTHARHGFCRSAALPCGDDRKDHDRDRGYDAHRNSQALAKVRSIF